MNILIAIIVFIGASILFSILSFFSPLIIMALVIVLLLAITRAIRESREIKREAEQDIRDAWTKNGQDKENNIIDAEYTEEDLD